MKKLLCIVTALCLVATAPVYAESYSEEHMRVVESYSVMPREVTVQYLIGENGAPEEVSKTLEQIRAIAEEVSREQGSVYEKAKAISGWVADNTYYDRNARDNGVDLETIALKNVLENHRTVCSGYANLTAAMLAAIGLKSVTVIGNTSIGEDNPTGNHHEWTAFWYEDENRWVLMDSGWDSHNYYDGEYVKANAPRTYFDMKAEEFPPSRRAVKAEFRDWFDPELVNGGGADNGQASSGEISGESAGNRVREEDDDGEVTGSNSRPMVVVFIAVCVVVGIIAGIIGFSRKNGKN